MFDISSRRAISGLLAFLTVLAFALSFLGAQTISDATKKPATNPSNQIIHFNIEWTPAIDGSSTLRPGLTQWSKKMVRVPCRFIAQVRLSNGGLSFWYRNALIHITNKPNQDSELRPFGGQARFETLEKQFPSDRWVTIAWTLRRRGAELRIDNKPFLYFDTEDATLPALAPIVAPFAVTADMQGTAEIKAVTAEEFDVRPSVDPSTVSNEEIAGWRKTKLDMLN